MAVDLQELAQLLKASLDPTTNKQGRSNVKYSRLPFADICS